MKKIAFINQRYGSEVNGGSEYYTRKIACQLKPFYSLEILTTCALDYWSWENHYPPGLSQVDDIPVRRFLVDQTRDSYRFDEISDEVFQRRLANRAAEEKWILEQGPLSSQLVSYIDQHSDEYDLFIFVTYLYYPTIKALPLVAEKSILIPTAHNEPYIHFHTFRNVFQSPAALIYLTTEEKKLVETLFRNEHIPSVVCALGIDTPKSVDGERFRQKHHLSRYFIYVGRIDESKGCEELFQFFLSYKTRFADDIKLVLMGKSAMDIPKDDNILFLGFVSEEEKYDGIAGAEALILPSHFESLSISVLEALSLSVPVLVNGNSPVLIQHCMNSGSGLYYTNSEEFIGTMRFILEEKEIVNSMKEHAIQYIDENYRWDKILKKLRNIIDHVISSSMAK